MPSTLQEAAEALGKVKAKKAKPARIADKLLGKFKGVIPKGKTSTEFVKGLRGDLYGKTKSGK